MQRNAKAQPAQGTPADRWTYRRDLDDEACWTALVQRDRSADGFFFYMVVTTGVYCRPSCPARLARRENVRFCETAAQAEQVGYRACKRCRPAESSTTDRHVAAVVAACRAIDEADHVPDLDALATTAGLSRFHFHRVFKALTGITPMAYATARRAQRVRDELKRGSSVTEAIYNAGFNSAGRFYSQSSKSLGMSPSRFRAGGAGVTIRFAVGECSLGSILVAASAKGVCAILLGDHPETLVHDFQERFQSAELVGDDAAFQQIVARVVGFVDAPTSRLDLPLDIRGTAFQQRVWDALGRIRPGASASYAEIAERIGSPKAVRAVARACASNMLAVAIPCHRVVRSDGSLSGYRWGVERKAALLAREASAS